MTLKVQKNLKRACADHSVNLFGTIEYGVVARDNKPDIGAARLLADPDIVQYRRRRKSLYEKCDQPEPGEVAVKPSPRQAGRGMMDPCSGHFPGQPVKQFISGACEPVYRVYLVLLEVVFLPLGIQKKFGVGDHEALAFPQNK